MTSSMTSPINLNAYSDYMIFISCVGNFAIYLQAYQLFRTRDLMKFSNPGEISRLLSYFYSTWICISWIIYATLVYFSTVVLISTVVLTFGDIVCITIIIASCIKNEYHTALTIMSYS